MYTSVPHHHRIRRHHQSTVQRQTHLAQRHILLRRLQHILRRVQTIGKQAHLKPLGIQPYLLARQVQLTRLLVQVTLQHHLTILQVARNTGNLF